ncbi:uncharacterized protein [Primulina huaijiensis]|uniref:uncharacterized protein n=1 Tax=Primulina huaijiensis TaxID=1492673 RepID=UPI003CC794D7
MAVLSSEKILQEKNTSDANSITSLALTHRALSDVSCLSGFKDLERLDLGFNSLNSLEGLKLCVNLKWLSVVQNKLHSLKGIEGLTKLAVLNAGKNKLRSMDEVRSLLSLRALILNDNEISSVCKLDQMKELNTLVLSRNPISSLGVSLIKLKAITKLSVSNCQLQTIDSALKSCAELKELRVAHNEITTIPSEISRSTKLLNLDLGNNLITKWSNVKELAPLVNLKNLNLQGNPVAGKENLAKKVKNLLPNLHIFNARPIDKILGKEFDNSTDKSDDITPLRDEVKTSHESRNKNFSKAQPMNETVNTQIKDAKNAASENKKRRKLDEKDEKSRKTSEVDKLNVMDDPETPFFDLFATVAPEIPTKTNDKKKSDHVKVDSTMKHEKSRKSTKRVNLNPLDDSETSFTDHCPPAALEIPAEAGFKRLGHDQIFRDYDRRESDVISMTIYKRNKKHVKVDPSAVSQLDVGLGGASSWA